MRTRGNRAGCSSRALGSRRGSYIAEAAVVLPFVILSVITIMLIVLFFYASSVSESRMHMALRCEAGLMTEKCTEYGTDGTVLSPDDLWDGSLTSSGVSPARRVSAKAGISMVSDGLLSRLGRRQLSDEMGAFDPVQLVRIRQIAHPARDSDNDESGCELQGVCHGIC